jgi:hypothetical protein
MQLQHSPMTIERYLKHYNYAIIRDDGKHKLVQLKNLKLVEIELREDNSYVIQEVTLGQVGEYWEVLTEYIDRVLEMEAAGII